MSFAKYIKDRRIELGYTQLDLAMKTGMGLSTIQSLERLDSGKNNRHKPNPTRATLERIAEVLQVSLEDMVAESQVTQKAVEDAMKRRFGPLFSDSVVSLLSSKNTVRCLNCLDKLSEDSRGIIADYIETLTKGMMECSSTNQKGVHQN